MKLKTVCPGCGKRAGLDPSLVGKKVRCKGCGHAFLVQGDSSGPAPDRGASELDAPADTSWLDDGADGEPTPVVPRRTRSASTGDGSPTTGLIAIGAGCAGLVALVIGLAVLVNRGQPPAPARAQAPPPQARRGAAGGLFDRVVSAVTGSDPAHDVAGYPDLGPLPPPLLPPAPLRDLAAHERQSRAVIAGIDQMAGILASVRDVASLKAAGEQLQNLQSRALDELSRNPPPFQLTPAEEAELTRRTAPELRGAMARVRQESQRLTQLPWLGSAGVQLVSLIDQRAAPAEMAMRRAEEFRPPPGPAPYVEVYIRLRKADDTAFFQHKFESLLDGPKGVMATYQAREDDPRASLRVWPVEDAAEFARKIPHGKAEVKGRRIFVEAEPIPADELAAAMELKRQRQDALDAAVAKSRQREEDNDPKPPADADEITRALFALRSSNAGKRKEGVEQLARIAPRDDRRDEVHAALAALLGDPDGFLVNGVMKAMLAWRTDETAPALIKVLDRPDFGVRWEAEELLGKLGDPRAAAPLAARLKEDGIRVEPALRALGPAAEPALIGLLRDPDPHVRTQACRLLEEVGGEEALEAMMGLPADSNFAVQVAARDAMQAMRARVGPVRTPRKGAAAGARGSRPG
ncbi:HEAT repeat domain-containing protein [Paludisphaera sp.]|uniref:HEAT repeat domain-containing protein n=1 Tax=Paludisphaera sp. TaxID=2017432 RepID=UPI00301D9066